MAKSKVEKLKDAVNEIAKVVDPGIEGVTITYSIELKEYKPTFRTRKKEKPEEGEPKPKFVCPFDEKEDPTGFRLWHEVNG